MKRTPPRKTARMRMKEAPKALLCIVLALALSVAPAGPALAQAQRIESPVRTASAQAASGVTVDKSGVTIDGTFISKDDFLAAIASAKRVAYPQGPQAGQAAQRTGGMRTASVLSGASLQRASYGEGSGGVIVATTTANIIRAGLEALWGAAMDNITYTTAAAFAKNTAWLVSVAGKAYRFAFTDTGQLLLLAGDMVCSIAPCWLSIAVAQYASDHANDPVEGEGDSGAAPVLTAEAIKKAVTDVDSNSKHHILQDKHLWNKLVPDPQEPENWDKIAAIISQVLANGKQEPYNNVWKKTLEIGDEVVSVTFNIIDGVVRLSDAWVNDPDLPNQANYLL